MIFEASSGITTRAEAILDEARGRISDDRAPLHVKLAAQDRGLAERLRAQKLRRRGLIERTFRTYRGVLWGWAGDGAMFLFPAPQLAVDASLTLQDAMAVFNRQIGLKSPLYLRIGVGIGRPDLWNVPEGKRGELSSAELDLVGSLQKRCPTGRVAISPQVLVAVPNKRDLFRAVEPGGAGYFIPTDGPDLANLDPILGEPFVVVAGADAGSPDNLVMNEALAAVRANPNVHARLDSDQCAKDALATQHGIIAGSGTVNRIALVLNDLFPACFEKVRGRITRWIVTCSNCEEQHFGVAGAETHDVGLVAVVRNLFVREKCLLWVAGNTAAGTWAAGQALKDLVSERGHSWKAMVPPSRAPVALVLAADPPRSRRDRRAESLDPPSGYEVLWMVDAYGEGGCVTDGSPRHEA